MTVNKNVSANCLFVFLFLLMADSFFFPSLSREWCGSFFSCHPHHWTSLERRGIESLLLAASFSFIFFLWAASISSIPPSNSLEQQIYSLLSSCLYSLPKSAASFFYYRLLFSLFLFIFFLFGK